MAVTIRDLARRTSKVVHEVEASGRAALITRGGRPVAAIVPVDPDELLDIALAGLVPDPKEISREIAGGKSKPLEDVVTEIRRRGGR